MNYVPYHVHTYYSNPIAGVDSTASPEEYAQLFSDMGCTAMAVSEHGNVYNWTEKKRIIEEHGMKYIHAMECYVTERILPKDQQDWRVRDNYHCVLIAKNKEGAKEINRLSSLSFNREDGHFYYMPRITLDELMDTSNNIMITTACIAGVLGIKSNDDVRDRFLSFLIANKDRCYLEIQPHSVEKQIVYNKYLYDLHKKFNIPLIAGTDTHSSGTIEEKLRSLLQESMGVHYADEDAFDLKPYTAESLAEAFKKQNSIPYEDALTAIENTNRMADRVEEFKLDKSFKYPKIYENSEEVFKDKIKKAWCEHPYASKRYTWEEVLPRVTEEFEVMRDTGAIDFMLLQLWIREFEDKNGVHHGFGRGSCGGSFICYLLGITNVDSIKYNLPFSRFMSRERINLGDIDTDYDDESRTKTKDFLITRHLDLPQMESTEIITFGTLQTRKAIDYLGKVYGYDLTQVKEIKEQLDEDGSIPDKLRRKNPEMFKFVDKCIGVVVSTGSHASGNLVTDRRIEDYIGTCTNSGDQYPICQISMVELDKLNYVKFDLLGLRTLQHINLCSEYAGLPYLTPDSPEIDDLQDVKVYRSLRDNTTMIFQFESDMAFAFVRRFFSDETFAKILRRMGDIDFAQLGAISTAALRPSGTSYRADIADGNFVDYELKPLQDYLDPTFGRLIFQESITGWLQKFCGYTAGMADVVRRAISKKHPEVLAKIIPEIKEKFVSYTNEKYNVPKEDLEELITPFIQVVQDASSYAFNKAHSIAYFAVSYISAWQRLYYPLEWVCAGLNAYNGYEAQTTELSNWAKHNGITIKKIAFRESRAGYSFDKETNSIYKGIDSVKFLNAQVAEELYALRGNDYRSFVDLLCDIRNKTSANARQIKVLIKLGYFNTFGEINALLMTFDMFDNVYKAGSPYKNMKISTIEKNGLDPDFVRRYARGNITEKTFSKVDIIAMLKQLEINYDQYAPKRSLKCIIDDQNEYLGYIDVADKKYKNIVYVMEVNTRFSPRLKLVALANGGVFDVKIPKRAFKKSPVEPHDILKIYHGNYRPKSKLGADGEWHKDYKETELWINSYEVWTEMNSQNLTG